jgi:adenylyltransferase/sulfurtransferase
MLLPAVGVEGQRRLASAHAAIVGVGALGSVVADLLCRAGVGTLTLVDRDVVELTNLQRQTLYDQRDVGTPKVEAAARRLGAINSSCRVYAEIEDLHGEVAERVLGLLGPPDSRPGVLIDGADNFELRFLLNDLSVKHGVPLVYAGAVGSAGTQGTFTPALGGPCLRCVLSEPPAGGAAAAGGTCDTAGIFAPVSMIVAACQAADAIKLLLGRADLLSGTLLSMDLMANQRRRVDLRGSRDPDCPCCGQRRFEFLDARRGSGATVLCGRNSVQIGATSPMRGDLLELHDHLRRAGVQRLEYAESLVRCTLEGGHGLTVFADGRAIISGTTDIQLARSLYARYVGA